MTMKRDDIAFLAKPDPTIVVDKLAKAFKHYLERAPILQENVVHQRNSAPKLIYPA
jgi:hypothetical protein